MTEPTKSPAKAKKAPHAVSASEIIESKKLEVSLEASQSKTAAKAKVDVSPKDSLGSKSPAKSKSSVKTAPVSTSSVRTGAVNPGSMAQEGGVMILRQKSSTIRCTERQRQTVKGLGLRHIGHVKVLIETPASYGMFLKVSHLVERLAELPAGPRH
jgi:large subunit ribosomal protein L30